MRPRNPQAKSLMSKLFKPRVVKPKKGKGSYSRKRAPPGNRKPDEAQWLGGDAPRHHLSASLGRNYSIRQIL